MEWDVGHLLDKKYQKGRLMVGGRGCKIFIRMKVR